MFFCIVYLPKSPLYTRKLITLNSPHQGRLLFVDIIVSRILQQLLFYKIWIQWIWHLLHLSTILGICFHDFNEQTGKFQVPGRLTAWQPTLPHNGFKPLWLPCHCSPDLWLKMAPSNSKTVQFSINIKWLCNFSEIPSKKLGP